IKYEITADNDNQVLPPTTKRWNWKKADWDAFSKILKETAEVMKEIWTQLQEQGGHENLERYTVYLTRIIQTATALHVPQKKTMIQSKPWWNGEINEKRKIMRTRWREWKDARTTPARNQFKAVRNTFYNAIREAKSKNWNDFLHGAKGKEIFTAMRYTKPRRTDHTPDIIHGDERAQTFAEKAKLFCRARFPKPPTADIEREDEAPTRRLLWPRLTQKEIRDAAMSSA